jgi:hypothetical protein
VTAAAEGTGFRARWQALLAAERPDAIADAAVLRLPAQVPPWTDTGMRVAAGDAVTLLAAGRVVLSPELDLWGGPRVFLWGRVGSQGPVWNALGDTTTIRARSSGALELAVYQGEWKSPAGELATPVDAYAALRGGFDVAAIRWRAEPSAGIAALRARAPDDPLLAAEAARLAAPVRPPPGWEYLWFLGAAEIFRAARSEGRDAIHVRAENDLGILCHPVDFALGEATTLSWHWRVSQLPAREREDTLPTHDYLSVALEFEDGRDLTWTWSAALPVGTAYACPLPNWSARETHLVVRSGSAGLGAWQSESRAVLSDHRAAVGGAQPRRVVAVWLIAVSLFRHGTAEAEFAAIELRDGSRRLRVA